jgi:predicted ATP-dependent protease
MKEQFKVSYEDLVININEELTVYNCTKKDQISFLGQDKAIEVLDFGLQVHTKGYNIFLSGEAGTHKEQYLRKYIGDLAKDQKVPDDWCYVYNFDNELQPLAISLPAGMGRVFKEDVDRTISSMIDEIQTCLESEEHLEATNKLKEIYYNEGEKLLIHIKDRAKELGFYTQISESGLYFVPIVDGKKISESTYDELSLEEQETILKNLNDIEDESEKIMEEVKGYKNQAEEQVKEFEDQTIINIINSLFEKLNEKYFGYDQVLGYLERLKDDLIQQTDELIQKDDNEDDIKALLSSVVKEDDELPKKYMVNLLVDNSQLEGAPVIYCGNPNFNNIVGRIEYENELGNLVTDFSKIKAGLLHKANGGYLILHAMDVLTSPFVWEFMKKALFNQEIALENIREKLGGIPLRSVDPEKIPLDVKVILIGNQNLYQILYYNDEDFERLFKVHVPLDYEMDMNHSSILEYSYYIDKFLEEHEFLPITKNGKKHLLLYSAKLAGNRNKLSTKISYIENILEEAQYWAKKDESNKIDDYHIIKTLNEKEKRNNFIKEKIYDLVTDKKIRIDLKGSVVGQINGLAVVSYGECNFGKPSRITATTYMGQSGMINIEKEADLSGKIHNKGINILTGYLGQKYAQEIPLALCCRLCFEQNYSGIDGDSASSTELYAILSSLSEIPIKQNIAVTGSVDQRGYIQPIGGVTEKVDGFYRICKMNDFTNNQGVIIPKDNVNELILSEEILEDIKIGNFSIYAISHIEEGMEILTGRSIKEINEKIIGKLTKFHKNSKSE